MNKIAITMGDPAGVGPEIIKKFIIRSENIKDAYIIIGKKEVFGFYNNLFNHEKIDFITINEIDINSINKAGIYLLEVNYENLEPKPGEISYNNGKISMLCVDKAVDLAMNKIVDAMVTAPISKESINLAGYKYSGHTEFLAEKSQIDNFGMVLKGDKICVVLVSTHLSLRDAITKVKKDNILQKILLANDAKSKLGITTKIAVAGLNPHNGENGLFGNEEAKEITPAIEEAKKLGIDVEGPIVPDSLFVKMLKDEYNIAVVMYHDQGLIPMKMESFGNGVNVTVGLPFIRTSVDHGTAFDIAGKNIANEGSLTKAVETAKLIIKNS